MLASFFKVDPPQLKTLCSSAAASSTANGATLRFPVDESAVKIALRSFQHREIPSAATREFRLGDLPLGRKARFQSKQRAYQAACSLKLRKNSGSSNLSGRATQIHLRVIEAKQREWAREDLRESNCSLPSEFAEDAMPRQQGGGDVGQRALAAL
jgi:hypothetical protein